MEYNYTTVDDVALRIYDFKIPSTVFQTRVTGHLSQTPSNLVSHQPRPSEKHEACKHLQITGQKLLTSAWKQTEEVSTEEKYWLVFIPSRGWPTVFESNISVHVGEKSDDVVSLGPPRHFFQRQQTNKYLHTFLDRAAFVNSNDRVRSRMTIFDLFVSDILKVAIVKYTFTRFKGSNKVHAFWIDISKFDDSVKVCESLFILTHVELKFSTKSTSDVTLVLYKANIMLWNLWISCWNDASQ